MFALRRNLPPSPHAAMAFKRGTYSLFRQRFQQTKSKQTTFGNNVSTQKTDGSATLLSSASNTYYDFADIPGPRPSVPFIGTAWQYFPGGRYNLSNVYEASADKYLRYGSVAKEEFQWRKPVVHLFNPNDFETVAVCQGSNPVRPVSDFLTHYRKNRPEKYDSVGLANSVGEEWSRLRKVLFPVLNTLNKEDSFRDDINLICDDFVELIRKERNQSTFAINNLQDYLYRLSLEGVYMLCLETRLGCLKGNLQPDSPASTMINSVKLLFEAFQELYYGLPLWKLYPTSAYKKLDKAESIMYDATSSRIQELMEQTRNTSADEKSRGVLQTLLTMDDITDKERKVTIIDFISGGIFTITNAFCFLLCHMAKNPDVQEELYQELRKCLPKGSTNIHKDLTKHVPLLMYCIKESFRLTPTIPTITRILSTDIIASGYHVPAGVPLFCNFTVPCKHAQYFTDPGRFRPSRWFNSQARHKFMMLPFGFGSRMCVGRRFAETEMYTALAKIVLNFRLESTTDEVKCKQAFIIVPSHPVSIVFKEREKC